MYSKEEIVIDSRAYRFKVDSKYLFVSRKNVTGEKSDVISRRLYVSRNYASEDVVFSEVQLPSLSDQQVRRHKQTDILTDLYMYITESLFLCSSMLSWQPMKLVHSFMCLMEKVSCFSSLSLSSLSLLSSLLSSLSGRPNLTLASLVYRYRIWQLIRIRQYGVKVHIIADQSPLRGSLPPHGPLHHS